VVVPAHGRRTVPALRHDGRKEKIYSLRLVAAVLAAGRRRVNRSGDSAEAVGI